MRLLRAFVSGASGLFCLVFAFCSVCFTSVLAVYPLLFLIAGFGLVVVGLLQLKACASGRLYKLMLRLSTALILVMVFALILGHLTTMIGVSIGDN